VHNRRRGLVWWCVRVRERPSNRGRRGWDDDDETLADNGEV
jgi:hypothetical protein